MNRRRLKCLSKSVKFLMVESDYLVFLIFTLGVLEYNLSNLLAEMIGKARSIFPEAFSLVYSSGKHSHTFASGLAACTEFPQVANTHARVLHSRELYYNFTKRFNTDQSIFAKNLSFL